MAESLMTRKKTDSFAREGAPANPIVRGRGRPAVGQRPRLALRASEELHLAIQQWAERQIDAPNQSEAVRRLLIIALTAERRKEKAERRKDAPAHGRITEAKGVSMKAADAPGFPGGRSQPKISEAAE